MPQYFPVSELPAGDVTTAADTPDGFTLQNPGIRRTDFLYDSDNVFQGTSTCGPDGCEVLSQARIQFRESVQGGISHSWSLTMTMAMWSNAAGLTTSFSSRYWCGVNVTGASDTICENGAAPSDFPMSVNISAFKPWGLTNNITVFPMVRATTTFGNGVVVSTDFRGWDTWSLATNNRLATTSGTGG